MTSLPVFSGRRPLLAYVEHREERRRASGQAAPGCFSDRRDDGHPRGTHALWRAQEGAVERDLHEGKARGYPGGEGFGELKGE